jgi:hypothetical protein
LTRRELEACAHLDKTLSFMGKRYQRPQDRLFSLYRHKVLGKGAQRLDKALKQRKVEVEEAKNKQQRHEYEEIASVENDAQAEPESTRGTKRPHDSSDSDDAELSDQGPRVSRDEVNALLATGFQPFSDDNSDEAGAEDAATVVSGANPALTPNNTNSVVYPKMPGTNVCFREQTRHDRLKMQPTISKDEQIAKLRAERESLTKKMLKYKRRLERATDTMLKAEVMKRNAISQVDQMKAILSAERHKVAAERASIKHERDALNLEKAQQAKLNSKVNKDFW